MCLEEKIVLCLKEKPNFDCILWKDGCEAYEGRPVQCRTYPFDPCCSFSVWAMYPLCIAFGAMHHPYTFRS